MMSRPGVVAVPASEGNEEVTVVVGNAVAVAAAGRGVLLS